MKDFCVICCIVCMGRRVKEALCCFPREALRSLFDGAPARMGSDLFMYRTLDLGEVEAGIGEGHCEVETRHSMSELMQQSPSAPISSGLPIQTWGREGFQKRPDPVGDRRGGGMRTTPLFDFGGDRMG